jgi:hypothetical protein
MRRSVWKTPTEISLVKLFVERNVRAPVKVSVQQEKLAFRVRISNGLVRKKFLTVRALQSGNNGGSDWRDSFDPDH